MERMIKEYEMYCQKMKDASMEITKAKTAEELRIAEYEYRCASSMASQAAIELSVAFSRRAGDIHSETLRSNENVLKKMEKF